MYDKDGVFNTINNPSDRTSKDLTNEEFLLLAITNGALESTLSRCSSTFKIIISAPDMFDK